MEQVQFRRLQQKLSQEGLRTVSYTHLDVYKRQDEEALRILLTTMRKELQYAFDSRIEDFGVTLTVRVSPVSYTHLLLVVMNNHIKLLLI